MTIRYSDGSHPKILIVGAGLSGIILSIYLKQRLDIHDFIVLENEPEVGGTWQMNTYPGCACDVNSHLYSYYNNFNPNWSKAYSGFKEIKQYLVDTVAKFGIGPNIQVNTRVKSARFDDKRSKWTIKYENSLDKLEKEIEVDILIGGIGALRIPNIPKEFTSFKGPWMHSAKWDNSIDLAGKKVGVIGSGASAVQIIPNIIDKVKELHTFQRNPPFVSPRKNPTYSTIFKTMLKYFPILHIIYYWTFFLIRDFFFNAFYTGSILSKLATFANKKLIKSTINDPVKRELMTPKYHFGCKRVTPSNNYYQAINRDNLYIHDGNITKIDGNTLHMKDGTKEDVDVLILATGFKVSSPYKDLDLLKTNGDHIDSNYSGLGTSRPQLNYGITASKVPNFFMMLGPTTGLGHNSITFMLECQGNYIINMIEKMMKYDIREFDLKEEVGDAYWKWVQRRIKPMVWHGNCKSWYQNANGEVLAIWPGTCIGYYWKTKLASLHDYNCKPKKL